MTRGLGRKGMKAPSFMLSLGNTRLHPMPVSSFNCNLLPPKEAPASLSAVITGEVLLRKKLSLKLPLADPCLPRLLLIADSQFPRAAL